MDCQVTVTQGAMKGRVCTTPCGKNYYSFEGIPYAEPPVGPLRFRDPQRKGNWDGVLDATKPGNRAVQMNPFKGSIEGAEDCLYLNVYTPVLPFEKIKKLPVLFFIHGGKLIMGYGDYYRPDYLIRHDVILVTTNYRLNIFGFLCLHTPEVPGNAGLKDVAMALRWVKDNIGQFNGDASNIVAFGESAGAAIATSFLTSKMTDNLISKVIASSGTFLSDLFLIEEDPIEKAKEIASNMGHIITNSKDMYDLLSKASAEDLVGAYIMSEIGREMTVINSFMLPVVEKKFDKIEPYFTEYPLQAIRNNRFKNVPCLMTMATHEAALFLNKDESGNTKFNKNLRKYIPRYEFMDINSKNAFEFENRLKKLYFQDKEIGPATLRQYVDLISDAYFMRDIVYTTELFSNYKDNLYVCRFDYSGSLNLSIMKKLGIKGTTHGDLIQYIFYKEKKAKLCKENDVKVIDMLCEAWCNFAKSGKPSWTNQTTAWLPYQKNKRHCLNISDNTVECIPLPEFDRIYLWLDLVCKRSKL